MSVKWLPENEGTYYFKGELLIDQVWTSAEGVYDLRLQPYEYNDGLLLSSYIAGQWRPIDGDFPCFRGEWRHITNIESLVWARRGALEFAIVNDIICFVFPTKTDLWHAMYVMPILGTWDGVSLQPANVGFYETEAEAKEAAIEVAKIPF